MSGKCIRFAKVSKVYDFPNGLEKRVLNNITLTIRRGEFVGIAGMNGSGKSTLARMMNGLILPTSGEVMVNGMSTQNRWNTKNIRSLVGMVFQNPDHQFVSPVVEDDLAFGLLNLGFSREVIKERIDWVLKVLNIEDLRTKSPHSLSGGQKQKVAIASVLAMGSTYLVLDEPTSMLDYASRKDLIKTLRFLNKKYGITIILISHFMEDMAEADRIIVLDRGEIHHEDVPWKIFMNSEKLHGGIIIPDIVYLLHRLRERGHKIDQQLVTSKQVEEWICQSLKQTT